MRLIESAVWRVCAVMWLAGVCVTAASAQDLPFDPALASRGRALFQKNCMQCHGVNMVTAGVQTYDLRKFPLDQKERFVHSVTRGKGNMPALGERFVAEEIDALFEYIKTRGKPLP
jgi:mono/diheme cytochrome c family protein